MSIDPLQLVYQYHHESKHHPERYAPGPGGLDWATQPDPFRVYEGAPALDLDLGADCQTLAFTAARAGMRLDPSPLDLMHIGVLLELSFGLSAWKSYGHSRWALRCNPSSGNLHPTECYLVTTDQLHLEAGVYHYVSRDHSLEQRALFEPKLQTGSPSNGLVLALSSIHWREAWKYGLRAYRYCQHDAGHALAAVGYAAAALGWRVVRLGWSDAELAAALGLDRAQDFDPAEREAPDLALWVGDEEAPQATLDALLTAPRRFAGVANRLSPDHLDWYGIETVHQACERPTIEPKTDEKAPPLPPILPIECTASAANLIRRRRSAVAFDGTTQLPAEHWFAMLDALLPRSVLPPHDTWNRRPLIHLVLFVHWVEGVDPGLYVLLRDEAAISRLRPSLRDDWSWERVSNAPAHFSLWRLVQADARAAARGLSCHQDIAADSCFAVAMLAEFDAALKDGPWHYRELFWECGLLGQILYLEAEAAGVRGTGIGCFFDDAVHDLLGIRDSRWQSLYHFTVGGPLEDLRLQTEPPYAHLDRTAA